VGIAFDSCSDDAQGDEHGECSSSMRSCGDASRQPKTDQSPGHAMSFVESVRRVGLSSDLSPCSRMSFPHLQRGSLSDPAAKVRLKLKVSFGVGVPQSGSVSMYSFSKRNRALVFYARTKCR
jgi:hypothetical protein